MKSLEIPKIIWQTHEWEYDDLPQNFKAASLTWQNLNPDWEYRYMDAKQREHYVREADYLLYKIYLLSDKVSQADMWRYLVTYEHGGVYADMDSVCTTPLTNLVKNNQNGAELMANPIADGVVFNSNFAVVKNSEVMRKIIESLTTYYQKTDFIHLLMHCDNMQEFWEQFAVAVKLHPGLYIDVVVHQHPELVSFKFTGFRHESSIKTDYDFNFEVDYYDRKVSYIELAKELDWETYIT